MIISQNSKHNFYTQTGSFSFLTNVNVDTNSGVLNFGFSGDSLINFSLISGRIIDHTGNYFSSYTSNQVISLSGNVTPTTVDYYINGYPYGIAIPRKTGSVDYFYANPNHSVASLNLFINGEIPTYTVTDFVEYNTGDMTIPVSITNESLPFRIFSGDFIGDKTKFSLSGLPTGDFLGTQSFYFNQSGIKGSNSLSLNLYTNFGLQNVLINASGIESLPTVFTLGLNGPNLINSNNPGAFYCYFSNPTGNMTVIPSLTYESGSGTFYTSMISTGSYGGLVSGFVNGSGFLSGVFNVPVSGFGGQINAYNTGSIMYTGLNFTYATGFVNYPWAIVATGIGHTGSFTGLATGIISGNISGTVLDGSGFLSISTNKIQSVISCYSEQPTGYLNATGLINFGVPLPSDILYINDNTIPIVYGFNYSNITGLTDYVNTNTGLHFAIATHDSTHVYLTSLFSGSPGSSELLSLGSSNIGSMGIVGFTGGLDLGIGIPLTPTNPFTGFLNQNFNATGFYSKTGTGIVTGNLTVIDYVKTFFNVWDIKTGISIGSMVSFAENGMVSGNTAYIGNPYTKNFGSFYMYINYVNPFGGNDVSQLSITGLGFPSGIVQTISGLP